jgi:hypothetical protein
MTLQQRIAALLHIGAYMSENDTVWQETKKFAEQKNGWFTQDFIDYATNNITQYFLQSDILEKFTSQYNLSKQLTGKKVGIVIAGNIPLVGFHDFMCVLLSGHTQVIKLSEKDDVLLKHLVNYASITYPELKQIVVFETMLKNCDAYIATGSNNSARYFEQYFGKYPNIIRKNKTSVAVLTGNETTNQLIALADDVHLFFGLGCRNVTKIYVPENYDFVPLLTAFKKYGYFEEHNKYKNNYDYNLAIHILNKVYYMTNESILLIEDERLFSPISQLHYSYYTNITTVISSLTENENLQCVVGDGFEDFGKAQQPQINQFADGVNTMLFLQDL